MTLANDIIAAVCEASGVSRGELLSERRARRIARPRQLAMKLMIERTGMSYPNVGRKMGDRDHTTVMHGVKAWDQAVERGEDGLKAMEDDARATLDGDADPDVNDVGCLPPVSGLRNKWIIKAMQRLGRYCTRTDVADEVGICDHEAGRHMKDLMRAGYVRMEHVRKNTHYMTATHDVTGRPRISRLDARYPNGIRPDKKPCRHCGKTFQPEAKTQIWCEPCRPTVQAQDAARLPVGMEAA